MDKVEFKNLGLVCGGYSVITKRGEFFCMVTCDYKGKKRAVINNRTISLKKLRKMAYKIIPIQQVTENQIEMVTKNREDLYYWARKHKAIREELYVYQEAAEEFMPKEVIKKIRDKVIAFTKDEKQMGIKEGKP